MLCGNDGNDSSEFNVVLAIRDRSRHRSCSRTRQTVVDGGAGTDVLTVDGSVYFVSTMTSIEGVNLMLPLRPAQSVVAGPSTDSADLIVDSAHLAMLPSNAFFTGGGTVEVRVINGTAFDGSHHVITPTAAAIGVGVPITFNIKGPDGDRQSYIGTATGDRN